MIVVLSDVVHFAYYHPKNVIARLLACLLTYFELEHVKCELVIAYLVVPFIIFITVTYDARLRLPHCVVVLVLLLRKPLFVALC